jgi:hypothetical protein
MIALAFGPGRAVRISGAFIQEVPMSISSSTV